MLENNAPVPHLEAMTLFEWIPKYRNAIGVDMHDIMLVPAERKKPSDPSFDPNENTEPKYSKLQCRLDTRIFNQDDAEALRGTIEEMMQSDVNEIFSHTNIGLKVEISASGHSYNVTSLSRENQDAEIDVFNPNEFEATPEEIAEYQSSIAAKYRM